MTKIKLIADAAASNGAPAVPPVAAPQNTAAVAAPAPKKDYSAYIGKLFDTKNETGLNSDRQFKIVAVETVNFGTVGAIKGKHQAFMCERVPGPGRHWHECEDFLATHDEVKPAAGQPAEVRG